VSFKKIICLLSSQKQLYNASISHFFNMKRKFKQWKSTFPPISIKRTITSHLNGPLNIKNDRDIWSLKSRSWFGTGTEMWRVKPVSGISALPLFTSNDNTCMAFLNLEGPKYSSNRRRSTNLSEQEIFTCKINNSTAFLNVILP